MPAYAFIILAETPLILTRAIAPWAGCPTAIARRGLPQPSLVPLIARPGLPRRIIARPAIAHLQLLDIAPPAGRTQALRARRPGRSPAERAAPGQRATRRDGSAINESLDRRSSLHVAQIALLIVATRCAQNGLSDFSMLFSFAEDSSKLKTASGRRISFWIPGLETEATNLFGVKSGGVVLTNVLNGGNDK